MKKSTAKIVLGVVSGALAAGAAGCARNNGFDESGNNAVGSSGRTYGGGGYYGGTRIRPGIGSGIVRSRPGVGVGSGGGGSTYSSPRGGFGSTGRSGGGFFSGG